MKTENNFDFWGVLLITCLLLSLTYAGYLAYISIDWDVLKRLESQPLIIQNPPDIATSSATISPTLSTP